MLRTLNLEPWHLTHTGEKKIFFVSTYSSQHRTIIPCDKVVVPAGICLNLEHCDLLHLCLLNPCNSVIIESLNSILPVQ